MQLTSTQRSTLSKSLAAASCVLLSGQCPGVNARDEVNNVVGAWNFDTAILLYSEDGGRVQAVEPVISATRHFADDAQLNLKLVVDSLTGASPNGATPSARAQTFTTPSGKSDYTIAASANPLDDTFKDTRTALAATWSTPINSTWAYSAGLYGSSEYDYQSFGANGNLSRFTNDKNTQWTLGAAYSSDIVKPVGDLPVGLARVAVKGDPDFADYFGTTRYGDTESKKLTDLLVGVTQIINRRTIMQWNYSWSSASGYLTDPYKLLSVINATNGDNLLSANGIPLYVAEKRPDSRTKHALFWQTKYMRENGHVIDGSYRFMTDDWGVNSHTLELKYRWQLAHYYLEPHLRLYTQTAADFYQRYLLDTDYQGGNPTLSHASADYRLGDLTGTTLGVKYARSLGTDQELSVRVEYFLQSNTGNEGFGLLAQQELYPDTKAVMVTLGYSF